MVPEADRPNLAAEKLGGGSAFTVESEYAKYDKLGGYNGNYGTDKGGYVLTPTKVLAWDVRGFPRTVTRYLF